MNTVGKLYKIQKNKECIKLREKIAKNIYYMNRAHEKLHGIRYVTVMKYLQKENSTFLRLINAYECKNKKTILSTLNPSV